jgi:hypothetical protein
LNAFLAFYFTYMNTALKLFPAMLLALVLSFHATAQKKKEVEPAAAGFSSETFSALKFRSIGPAVTSGRISDFAVNPQNHSEYYVAGSSGGVWKTTNRGVTYQPIFDDQGSYSIGCVALDPANPNGGVGGYRRKQQPALGGLWRRRLQERGRRQKLEKHGAQNLRTHRQNHRAPQ